MVTRCLLFTTVLSGSFEPDDVLENEDNIEQHKQGTYFPGVYQRSGEMDDKQVSRACTELNVVVNYSTS